MSGFGRRFTVIDLPSPMLPAPRQGQPFSRRRRPFVLLQGDGALRAVSDRKARALHQLVGDLLDQRERVTEVVDVEQLRGQGLTAVVSLTRLAVHARSHGSRPQRSTTIGSGPTPCQTGSTSGATWKSGNRFNSSSRATRTSRRPRFDPRQRCTPTPKAKWGLSTRSILMASGSGKTDSSRFPDPNRSSTRWPASSRRPRTSTSFFSVLAIPWTGAS